MSPGEPLDDEATGGLAGERTDLAWSRSGLAVVAAVAAIAKRVIDVHAATAVTIVFVIICAGALAWALALAHARTLAAPALAGRAQADPAKLRYVAWGTAALGVGALILAIAPD